jgi:hypothetical protein
VTVLTDQALARRARWRLAGDPHCCRHVRGFYQPLDAEWTQKRCRRCGTTLAVAPRCPAPTLLGRQCLLPVRQDLGYGTCSVHAEEGRDGR